MADVTSPIIVPRTPAELSQGGPMPLFEQQLKILNDSYITFFVDRIKIEETYAESMRRLHAKAHAIDGYLDDRTSQSSSARQVWREIRDNVEREADSRQAFVAMLRNALNPLLQLRETQERTKKRIREDIKESTIQHTEYAENTLPRLKRTYMKRCQEADEHRAASKETPASMGSTTTTTTTTATTTNNNNNTLFDSSRAPPQRSHTVATPSQARLGGRPTSMQAEPRNRSPSSTGGALADLAHQGKKGLTQLKGFLDGKGSGAPANAPSARAETALRGVRAKRDADEADQEYRKAIHWLETLRLNRVKILEGAYNSLETFVRETTDTINKSLIIYVDNLIALAKTNNNFADHAASVVAKISADKDAERIHALIGPSKALSIPDRVVYENAHYGLCPDICFGVALVDYAQSRNLPDGGIPRVVRLCIAEIEKRGLESEGIFRISGRHAAIQGLVHKLERNERAFRFDPKVDDVYCVASFLKLYLRQLPEPVFRFPMAERMQHTEDHEAHAAKGFAMLRSKIRRLPPVHQATLKAVLELLANVAAHVSSNKMDVKNLAIVFGAVIFGEDEIPKDGNVLALQTWKDTVMEDLIVYARDLFDPATANPSALSPTGGKYSPPLPVRRVVEHAQRPYQYGAFNVSAPDIQAGQRLGRRPKEWDAATSTDVSASSESLVFSSVANPAPVLATPAPPPHSSSPSEDFRPQFGNYPPMSIHPSRRHGKTPSISSSQLGSSTGLVSDDDYGVGDVSFGTDATEVGDDHATPRPDETKAPLQGLPSTLTGPRTDEVRHERNHVGRG
ncbi:RhoGAP-domain-containing protein [Auriculariales sp. MPI-PUGE-AT-0066]|nr:RhoGAP-domain-containing protein [Auriculariales sp. MPI-PUGE-AT-0066]